MGSAGFGQAAVIESQPVSIVRAAEIPVVGRVPVVGTLVIRDEVLVNSRITGYAIESVLVEEGDSVVQGQVLAVLDKQVLLAHVLQAEAELLRSEASAGQAQSQIDLAKANLTEAAATLERIGRLRSSASVSQSSLDQAKAAAASASANVAAAVNGLKVAEAQTSVAASKLDLAKLDLARADIKSPVDGVVYTRNALSGSIASAGGEPMFRLIQNGTIEAEVDVIETRLGELSQGDEASLLITGIGEKEGHIRRLPPAVDQRTRLGKIRITLPSSTDLLPGVSVDGWILVNRHTAISVPGSAVLTDGTANFVQVVVDDRIEEREVKAGLLTETGMREILSGLAVGEAVVEKAGAFYADGDVIRAIEAAPVVDDAS